MTTALLKLGLNSSIDNATQNIVRELQTYFRSSLLSLREEERPKIKIQFLVVAADVFNTSAVRGLLKTMFSHFFGTKQVNENCGSVETFVKEILYGCGVFKTKVTHFFGFKLTHSVVVVLFVLEGWRNSC